MDTKEKMQAVLHTVEAFLDSHPEIDEGKLGTLCADPKLHEKSATMRVRIGDEDFIVMVVKFNPDLVRRASNAA